MKLNYYSDTDSLYIDLSEQPSVESREISEGIVLDYDAAGNLVGIDIDNASRKVESRNSFSTNFRQSSRTTQPSEPVRIDNVMGELTVSPSSINGQRALRSEAQGDSQTV